MKKYFRILIATALLMITIMVACSDKLDVTDQNNPTTTTYFKTAAELQNGVNAVYSTLRSAQLVGREWFFTHDMRGGDCASGGAQLESPRAELLNQPSPAPTNAVMTNVWTGCYQMINRANQLLALAPDVDDNVVLRDRVVGEAKFLRAWAYYELVSQWGDVPLYVKPLISATDFQGKATSADIYNLIVQDLTDAANILPATYGASNLGRATKGAANAMLGRVLMQKGDYAAAKTALLKVYGQYSLVNDYSWNFDGDVRDGTNQVVLGHEFNTESIFEVVFVDKGDANFNWGYNGEGSTSPLQTVRNQEYGITWGNVIPSNRFLNEFEAGDPRYKFIIFEEGDQILTQVSGTPITLTAAIMNIGTSVKNGVTLKRFFRKYNVYDWFNSGFHPAGINQRLIRYADVLLMLAECEAEIGSPAQAATYINMVRSRPSVNLPAITAATKNDALKAVIHERRVELGAESVANIDLLRWRKKGYFPSLVADWVPGQVDLFPIPASETSTNPLVK